VKYNPFQPNGIATFGTFVGRIDELDAVEKSLFQTKNGNPHHFLIEGERGIGKSSLFFYVELVASGQVTAMDDSRFEFLTVSVDLNGCTTPLEIVCTIARGLKTMMGTQEVTRTRAKQVWDFLRGWEILGVSYRAELKNDVIDDARDTLVDNIVNLCLRMGDTIDGILLLIDEADNPSPDAELGQFVKLFTERLTRRGCSNVVIGMAGLPSVINTLKASHESSARIFEIYALQPLEKKERESVVKNGLALANKKNKQNTEITPDAITMICELSEGYPHFLQQFAHSAFAEDRDNVIDVHDVMQGAFKENGALAQLGQKYFNEMYHARINSDDYRRVLDTMANHGDDWVARKTIIEQTPSVSEHVIGNALSTLRDKDIILQEDGRRGFYKLPTKSFATWINALKSARAEKEAENEPRLLF